MADEFNERGRRARYVASMSEVQKDAKTDAVSAT